MCTYGGMKVYSWTTFMHKREGSGNAENGGLFHDTRFASPWIEHQSNIQEDRTSPEHGTETNHSTNITRYEENCTASEYT